MHRHADGYQPVADIHRVSYDAINPASNQASGIHLPVLAAAMDVFETDGDEPDGLAEQGQRHARYDKNSIHERAAEHDLGTKRQGPDDKYEREERVTVAKKQIADGDVPGVQSITVLLRLALKF